MRATVERAPDCAPRNAAQSTSTSSATVQAIILSAQTGLLKEFAAFCSIAGFIAAVSICLPG